MFSAGTYLFPEVDGRALQDAAHQLVRIPGHGVCPLDAGEPSFAQALAKQVSAAPRGVDVQPHVVLFAYVRDRVDWVERAENCCAASAVDVERLLARRDRLLDKSLEFVGAHLSSLVDWHVDDIVRAEAASGARAFTRVVAVFRSEQHELLRQRPQALRLALGKLGVARHDQRVQVRDGAARRKD